jgi:hypothetical protein
VAAGAVWTVPVVWFGLGCSLVLRHLWRLTLGGHRFRYFIENERILEFTGHVFHYWVKTQPFSADFWGITEPMSA